MKIEGVPFQTIDWSKIDATEHPGEKGVARWRTVETGNVRVRMVEYSPGTSPIIGASAVTSSSCSRASS